MDFLNQKTIWDHLSGQNAEQPYRAVISNNDIYNYYVDKTQKMLFSQVVKTKKHFKVLDIGCGVGRWSLWLSPQVDSIVGVDISSNMLEIAKKTAILSDITNIKFFVVDDSLKIFKDNEFDLVICVWVLKYIMDLDKLTQMIKEICRVTKVGGHVVIIEQVDQKGPRFLGKEDISGQSILRSPVDYISLFEDCRLKLVKHYITLLSFYISIFLLLRKKLKFKKYSKIELYFSKIVIYIDLLFNRFMKENIKKNGHHFLYFRKIE